MELPAPDLISISRTPQPVQAGERTVRMTARVRAAVEAMVWQGLKRDEAAAVAGMKDNSLYAALRKPGVRAFYLAECEVLRLSGRARRIHRLEGVVEQDDNKMAVVNAALALERLGDLDAAQLTHNESPGVRITIVNAIQAPPGPVSSAPVRPAFDPPVIDVKPSPAGPRRDAAGFLIDEAGERVFEARRDY